MEAGLMEIVRCLYRSWIYYTYFSLYRAIHLGGKSRGNILGEMSGYHCIYRNHATSFISASWGGGASLHPFTA